MKNKIKEFRQNLRLSQNDLALKIGLSKMNISYLERGLTIPKLDTAFKLANALKTNIYKLYSESFND